MVRNPYVHHLRTGRYHFLIYISSISLNSFLTQNRDTQLIQEYKRNGIGGKSISLDGELVDNLGIAHAHWEAKDSQDDLVKEVEKKFSVGYPKDNIIFQAPMRAILWQDGIQIYDVDITKPEMLINVLRALSLQRYLFGVQDFKHATFSM